MNIAVLSIATLCAAAALLAVGRLLLNGSSVPTAVLVVVGALLLVVLGIFIGRIRTEVR